MIPAESNFTSNLFCLTSDLGLRLEVDFVFPLSQEQQEEEEPPPKSKGRICTTGLEIGT